MAGFPSQRAAIGLILLTFSLALAFPLPRLSAATETTAQSVLGLLSRAQVDAAVEAWQEVSGDDPYRELAASTLAFHRGDYRGAQDHLDRLPPGMEGVAVDRLRERVQAALSATEGMLERQEGSFRYRFTAGVDAILVDYAAEALERQRTALAKLLGAAPKEPIVVEFFPSIEPFLLATGLPTEWVETTHTVAVAKWDRMMVLSPMNMPHGYPWLDTLAHEYTHLALSRATDDRAPIWFQEGAAKFLEGRWRQSRPKALVGPWAESLLVQALRADSLLPFDAMHPSMAALPSQEMAALAFAQVAYAMEYLVATGGEEGFRRLASALRDSGDAVVEAEAMLGIAPGRFEDQVRRHIQKQGLEVRAQVRGFELQLERGAAAELDRRAEALDPVLLADRRMEERTRIGDLLRLRGHPDAAFVAYERAVQSSAYSSPALETKRAHTLQALGRGDEAVALLESTLALYPNHTPAVELLGGLRFLRGDDRKAEALAWRGIALNPFIPDLHQRLADLYARSGRIERAEHEQQVLRILAERLGSR